MADNLLDSIKTICVLAAFVCAGSATGCVSGENVGNDLSGDVDIVVDSMMDEGGDVVELDGSLSDEGIVDQDVPAFDAEVTDSADADVTELPDYGFSPVESVTSCVPTAEPCVEAEVVTDTFASYRKDYFFPSAVYNELTEEPLDGGRFHIAVVSAVTGTITSVEINGQNVEEMLVEPLMEWSHVWPEQVVEGQPVWFAFHSRNPAWDTATTGTIKINTDSGTAVDATFPVNKTALPIGHVILDSTLDRLIIHLKNTDTEARTVSRIIVNGRDVTGAGIACMPSSVIAPGATVMWEIPFCQAVDIGTAYTVVVDFEDAPPSVSVGRLIRPFFPIEVWPSTSDCALPGHENGFFDLLSGIGVDTVYYYWNGFDRCGFDRNTMLGQTMPDRGDAYVLLGDDFPFEDPPHDALPDRRAVLGFLTGDESDWDYYDDAGYPKAALKAAKTTNIWRHFPDILTYNGAMTNKHIGTFAGMADVQGIDFYNAACAPHITEFGVHPPLRGPFDYLKNARNNHMPWRTWFYSQGTGGWDGHAAPHEVKIQALEVMACGAKGLMWFMATIEGEEKYPDTWQAMSDVNRMFRAVRPYLLFGDITGLAQSDPDTVVDMIRARDALVVPVITVKASKEMTDDDCAYYSLGILEQEPHWVIEERTVDVTVTVPDDFAVTDMFELTAAGIAEVTTPILVQGRTITLKSVPVSDAEPVHVFVFGANAGVRDDVSGRLAAAPPR